MAAISCLFCPLYCPTYKDILKGYCTAPFPPLSVDLRESYPFNGCPCRNDLRQVEAISIYRGFSDRRLKRIAFYAVSDKGTRSPLFNDLRKIRDFIDGSDCKFTIIAVYYDSDDIPFYRAVIPEDLKAIT